MSRRLDIDALRALQAIALQGGVTRAAENEAVGAVADEPFSNRSIGGFALLGRHVFAEFLIDDAVHQGAITVIRDDRGEAGALRA